MILTIPILLYQLFFVGLLYVASRFGRTTLNIVAALCLLWTATHLFFVPLAVLQSIVIVGSYLLLRNRSIRSPTRSSEKVD